MSGVTLGVSGLAPEAKFVLLWCHQFLTGDQFLEPRFGTKALAAELGVGVAMMYRSLAALVEHGYLAEEKIRTKGRSATRYRLPKSGLFKVGRAVCPHEAIIQKILFGVSGSFDEKLVLRDRLLLAVLFYHADICGVVRSLGMADIEALTGIGGSAVLRRLDRLREQGFLDAHVAGTSGSFVFGRTKSIYFLDLCHPWYVSSLTTECEIKDIEHPFTFHDLAARLLMAVQAAAASPVSGRQTQGRDWFLGVLCELRLTGYEDAILKIAKHFKLRQAPSLEQTLQAFLEQHGCSLVRYSLGEWAPPSHLARLKERVRDDLKSNIKKDRAVEGFLILLLLQLSWSIATEIASVIEERRLMLDETNVKVTAFAILPKSPEKRVLRLVAPRHRTE